MIFNLKKEITIFLAIFFFACFAVYLFLNSGAYLKILRYDLFGFENQESVNSDNKSYYLYIPKIGVSSPIVFPKDNSERSILESIKEGTAFYPGSQLPGQNGRAVILGHNAKVFALLSKLQNGDEFYISSGNKKLVYKVFSNDILTPKQTDEFISQKPGNKSDAALITCWPIGSSLKRTVIQAKLDHVEKI